MIANGPSGATGQIAMSTVEIALKMPEEVLYERKCLEARNAEAVSQNLSRVIMAHAQVKSPSE